MLCPDPPGNEPPDHFEYDPQEPVPTRGGVLSVTLMTSHAEEPMRAGPVDQQSVERRGDVLVYTSSPLECDTEVIGPVTVVLYAESSARDTDFTARLTDVDPAGCSRVMTEGIIRARYRKSLNETELLEPGVADRFQIELWPVGHVFRKGHCFRLDISSSNFPRFSRNLNTGEEVATGTRMQTARQTVLHSTQYPSHIILPLVDA